MPHLGRRLGAVTAALAMSVTAGALASPASAHPRQADNVEKRPTATGYGGAVSTVDPDASAAAIEILRKGGNAVDAAVAAAATLGVTEPYSAGVGGGGYFVFYDAKRGKVSTIDGRETAPAAMPRNAFIDPASPADKPAAYPFKKQATSGMSVGVPGTPATWERALDRWGSMDLAEALEPAIDVAEDGFVVDETFRLQTAENQDRFAPFAATRELFRPEVLLPPWELSLQIRTLPRRTGFWDTRAWMSSMKARLPRKSSPLSGTHPHPWMPKFRFPAPQVS
jgi:gamma-glutamyltranspeptidase/glutathione hydrolase